MTTGLNHGEYFSYYFFMLNVRITYYIDCVPFIVYIYAFTHMSTQCVYICPSFAYLVVENDDQKHVGAHVFWYENWTSAN